LFARGYRASKRSWTQVVRFVQEVRRLDLMKSPGVAETLDWAQALMSLGKTDLNARVVEETLDACRSRWRIRPGSGRQELRRNWRIVVRSYEIARIAIIAGIAKIENLDSSILAIPAIMAISRLGLRYNMHLTQTITEFSRFARERGLSAGVKETLAAMQAAEAVGVADRETFKSALRSALCSSKEDWDLFEPLFESFWATGGPFSDSRFPTAAGKHPVEVQTEVHIEDQRSPSNTCPMLFGSAGGERQAGEDGGRAVSGASALEQLKSTDFAAVPHHDQVALEQIALRLLRQMSLRLSRRLQTARSRGRSICAGPYGGISAGR